MVNVCFTTIKHGLKEDNVIYKLINCAQINDSLQKPLLVMEHPLALLCAAYVYV